MKKANIKTILVPIDFSKFSAPAIQVAKDLARRFGASIHLVHVHEFFYPMDLLAPVPMSVATFRDDAATRRTRRLKILAKRNGLEAENCHFMTGVPTFHEICTLARRIAADLIVMPTHGYTGLAHFLGGSTAERIVQHSPCPVLVVRGASEKTNRVAIDGGALRSINTILVPVDFSEASFQAIEYAIEFAERVAARLIVFHAVNLAESFTANGYGMYDVEALEEAARRDAESQMQKFIGLAKFHRVQFETMVRIAPAVSEISALAQERDVDLIITATHGRTASQAFAHGQHCGTRGASRPPAGSGRAVAPGTPSCQTNEQKSARTAAATSWFRGRIAPGRGRDVDEKKPQVARASRS